MNKKKLLAVACTILLTIGSFSIGIFAEEDNQQNNEQNVNIENEANGTDQSNIPNQGSLDLSNDNPNPENGTTPENEVGVGESPENTPANNEGTPELENKSGEAGSNDIPSNDIPANDQSNNEQNPTVNNGDQSQGEGTGESVPENSTPENNVCGDDNHNYDGGTVLREATDDQEGSISYKCMTCGWQRIETIPRTGDKLSKTNSLCHKNKHTYGETIVVKAPTTEEKGVGQAFCELCGAQKVIMIPKLSVGSNTPPKTDKPVIEDTPENTPETVPESTPESKEEIPETPPVPNCGDAHSYDEGTILAEATETYEGTIKYVCTVCGQAKISSIPRTGAKLAKDNPTCKENGHSWGEAVVIIEPTVDKVGASKANCTLCGATKIIRISQLSSANASQSSEKQETQSQEEQKQPIQQPEQSNPQEREPEKQPEQSNTQEQEPEKQPEQDDSQNKEEETSTPAQPVEKCENGHNWDSGTVMEQPTTEHVGSKLYVCQDCGAKKLRQLGKLSGEKNSDITAGKENPFEKDNKAPEEKETEENENKPSDNLEAEEVSNPVDVIPEIENELANLPIISQPEINTEDMSAEEMTQAIENLENTVAALQETIQSIMNILAKVFEALGISL